MSVLNTGGEPLFACVAYGWLSGPLVSQIYDEYGHEGLVVFEGCEMAKKSVGAHLKHPAEVRAVHTRLTLVSFSCK